MVIDFGASYCEPCWAELPIYMQLADAWQKRGVTFVFVSVDEEEKGRDRIRQATRGSSLVALTDPDQRAASQWSVRTLPQLFVVDARGRVRFFQAGVTRDTLDRLDATLERLRREAPM